MEKCICKTCGTQFAPREEPPRLPPRSRRYMHDSRIPAYKSAKSRNNPFHDFKARPYVTVPKTSFDAPQN